MQKIMSYGFTLIELSIVLIIIGLIVGGVLVGQDLINAASVRSQITQIEKYNSAVNTFRDKYGGIPGDLSINLANQFGFYISPSCTGAQGGRDGNGLIDGYIGASKLAALMGENALFWIDLGTAGLIDLNAISAYSSYWKSYLCSSSITASTPIGLLPPAKMGFNSFIHVYEANNTNWYLIASVASFSASNSRFYGTPSLSALQAYNIDTKMDDGYPTTGRIQAIYINGLQGSTSAAPNDVTDTASTCYNTTNYNYSIGYAKGANVNCALSFQFQ